MTTGAAVAFIAIDPGDTTGFAEFDNNGDLLGMGQIEEAHFQDWVLNTINDSLRAVIIEDYKILAHKAKAHSWSRVPTIKKIGVIESACLIHGVKSVLQANTVKATGYAWGGIVPASNHNVSHQLDAFAHGVYYLQQNGIRKPGQGLNLKKA